MKKVSRVADVVSQYLTHAKTKLGKTQTDVYYEMCLHEEGRPSNFLSLVKTGRSKLPLNRVEAFATACGIEDFDDLLEAILADDYAPLVRLMKRSAKTPFEKEESKIFLTMIDTKYRVDQDNQKSLVESTSKRTDQQRLRHVSSKWDTSTEAIQRLEAFVIDQMLIYP